MSRTVQEWIGKTDDEAIPARVKLRVFLAKDGRCEDCKNKITAALGPPQYDHVIALINGGENRESNVQLLCNGCHKKKTKADVAEKAMIYRKRIKHLGIGRKPSRFPCSRNSRFKKKISGEVVER